MELGPFPRHLERVIESIRSNPTRFYRRSEADKRFLLEQLYLWLDNHFQAQPPLHIRLRALSMNQNAQIDLEIRMTRFVRYIIFPDFQPEPLPLASDWFTFRFLQFY